MKKTLFIVFVLVVVVLAGAFSYSKFMSAPAPTKSLSDSTERLRPVSDITKLFRTSSDSKAEFDIREILYGKPKFVVGTTTAIAGDIAITNNDIVLGEFKIDASSFVTDSPQRNSALRKLILKTGTAGNEFITFRPTGRDFSGTIVIGKPVSFNVTGNLTIKSVTKPASFQMTMTVEDTKVTGTAKTTVKRSDFGLAIPNLSFIANVDEEVPVTIDIVAPRVVNK